MADKRGGLRLASGLWFVAGALALTAQAIRSYRGSEVRWFLVVAGVVCVAMGVNAWIRSNREGGPPATPPRSV